MKPLTGIFVLVAGVVLGFVIAGSPASAQAQLKGIREDKSLKIPTPLEVLASRVSDLEKRLDAKDRLLDAKDQAIDKIQSEMKARIDSQQILIDRVNYEMTNPSGQLGLKKKLTQKSGWDRLPNDAYFVYYQR